MILTSSKELLKYFDNIKLVSSRTISKFNGDCNVEIIIGTRQLVRSVEKLSFPKLKFIQLLSVGFEGIDIHQLKINGIQISNAGNVYSIGIAEFVVYTLLMSAKRYNKNIRNTRIRYQRDYKYLTELKGKTICIFGVGAIGYEVAKRVSGFDMQVFGVDLLSIEKPYFDKVYASNNIFGLLPQCDYIVLTVPLNEETHGSFGESFFNLLKHNATIINVGRQKLFNKNDLLKALKKNKEMTVILDMFEWIPNPITNPFRRLPNVKIIPGITAISKEITLKRVELIKENVRLVMNNHLPKHLI